MLTALYIIYAIILFLVLLSILLYGNRPSRSIAWLFIVIIVPVLGILLYFTFGINRKKFKFFTLNFNAKRKLYDLNHKSKSIEEFSYKFDVVKFGKVGRLLKKSSGFPAVEGNSLKLLKNGKQTFNAIFKACENAKQFIHIQYYILEEGKLLDKLVEILKKKISEGVEVRVLYDELGSLGWKNKSIAKLKHLGVDVYPLLPLKINTILSTLNYRNHRKIAIVDGKIAFTGGVNVSDKYVDVNSELGIWDDIHLQLMGPVVDHLHRVFIKDFYFASDEVLLTADNHLPKQKEEGNVLVQLVTGGPDHTYISILHQYVMMIHAAEHSICIENPYFIPTRGLLEAIKIAVLRGVEVKIMVPKNNDSKLAKYSMYANFEDLLKTGVQIYVLKDTFSHSKLIIVDEEIASIGSGNFDYRSFEFNYEINTLIYDKPTAKELVADFNDKLNDAERLDYETFKNRSIKRKLLEGCAKIFSPVL